MNHPIGRWLFGSLLGRLALLVAFGYVAAGADLAEARRQFLAGNYSTCVALAEKSVNDWRDTEEWQLLLSQSLLMLGKYPEARTAMTNALARDSGSVRLRWLAREVFQANGDTNAAANILDELGQLVATRTWAYRDAPDLVVVGRAALLRGADPKRVFEKLFDVAKKSDPTLRDVYLARGDLTLDNINNRFSICFRANNNNIYCYSYHIIYIRNSDSSSNECLRNKHKCYKFECDWNST